jgi:prepilin-type N-terminal cleavage/methylation domain-containing protein
MRITAPLRLNAFTLIELLTVIAIIAILMALLFPAIQSMRDSANKAQAKKDEMNIVAAVKAYNGEYGNFPNVIPNPASVVSGDIIVGDMVAGNGLSPAPISDNNGLFNILRNIADSSVNNNYNGNPKRIVFFEGKSVSNPASPKRGFLDNPAPNNTAQKGSFYDPWGTQYFIIINSDNDNTIDVGQIYTDFQTSLPQVSIGVFSFGKDRSLSSPSQGLTNVFKSKDRICDDVISWQ